MQAWAGQEKTLTLNSVELPLQVAKDTDLLK